MGNQTSSLGQEYVTVHGQKGCCSLSWTPGMPPALSPYMSEALYRRTIEEMNQAASIYARAMGAFLGLQIMFFMFFILFGWFFIFPMIFVSLFAYCYERSSSNALATRVQNLNATSLNGALIAGTGGCNEVFIAFHIPTLQTLSLGGSGGMSGGPMPVPTTASMVPMSTQTVVQQQTNQQFMSVVIPSSVSPGDQMTVMAPDGTHVSVVVPLNAEPGQTISVAYSTSQSPPPTSSPTYSTPSPYLMNMNNMNNMSNTNPNPYQQAPSSSRTMTVVVPLNAHAGDDLTVQAPDGTQVKVQVPPGTQGGSRITVAY